MLLFPRGPGSGCLFAGAVLFLIAFARDDSRRPRRHRLPVLPLGVAVAAWISAMLCGSCTSGRGRLPSAWISSTLWPLLLLVSVVAVVWTFSHSGGLKRRVRDGQSPPTRLSLSSRQGRITLFLGRFGTAEELHRTRDCPGPSWPGSPTCSWSGDCYFSDPGLREADIFLPGFVFTSPIRSDSSRSRRQPNRSGSVPSQLPHQRILFLHTTRPQTLTPTAIPSDKGTTAVRICPGR